MRLRPGVSAAQAIKTLRELAQDAENRRSWTGVGAEGLRRGRDQYLTWAEGAEHRLRSLLAEPDLIASLHSARYWRIHELDRYAARPHPLIDAEIESQVALLRSVADGLESFALLASRPGQALVLDTNVFLQCKVFTDIDWRKEFDLADARLVVPLVVLDELDDKTFSANRRLSRRADKVMRAFDGFMDDIVNDGVAAVRPNVTLEVLRDEDDHRRRANSDTEALDRAEFLHQVIERPVTVVTADRGMRVRGKARGLQIWPMPEHLRLPPDNDNGR